MRSLAEGLPSEIASQISPDWRKNEADYWAKQEELLPRYRGQRIGFADGQVIACGSSPVEVLHRAREAASHPFVACVGREREPCRMRRSAFPYDSAYPGEPLPVVSVEFRGKERILGRDVLNRLDVVFRGPSGEVVVNPAVGETG